MSLIKRKAGISLAIQSQQLKRLFPNSTVSVKRNKLVWIGEVKPTPMSETYTLKIEYMFGERPRVVVLKPKLIKRPNERLPHVYTGNELCLYRSKYNEWNSLMFISATILPWSILWLLYYEIWLVTGYWSGSKAEHPAIKD